MPHITSLGVGLFSDVSFSTDFTTNTWTVAGAGAFSEANWKTLFTAEPGLGVAGGATGKYRRIMNIRELPQMGTPPNIVNVPKYGSKTSIQIQGQADAPSFEVVLNYVPGDWISTADYLGAYIGVVPAAGGYPFRFSLLNSEPAAYHSVGATAMGTAKGYTAGATKCPNSQYFFGGKLEALQISPQLTDANQATLTISIQTDLYGPFTIEA